MGFGSFLKNVVTFGASGKVERKVAEYEMMTDDFNQLLLQVELRRKEVNGTLEQVIATKRHALESLKTISRISNNLSPRDRNLVETFGGAHINFSFDAIDQTITTGEIAVSSAKGVGAGVSTALGAWAIVGSFGAASTGTAISTLSGAAATNATLAYFGGGSLVAGGGGMAAGAAVLGGLVAVPALVLTGVFSHVAANKKIKEIAEKEYEIFKASEECQKALVCFDLIEKRAEEVIEGVQMARATYEKEFERIYRLIYPHIFSRLFKSVRKFFKGNYFSPQDIEHIGFIGQVASSLAKMIDQQILDTDGKPA